MGRGPLLLDAWPKRMASFSLAYPQARPWARVRNALIRGLLVSLLVWLMAASLFMLIQQPADIEQFRPNKVKHVLVIDSGSSGTRIYAYNWTIPSDAQLGTLPVVQAIPPASATHLIPKKQKAGLYNRVETQPGLDAFVGDPTRLSSEALQPLLAWARAVIPTKQHASTPLYLMGTGGLRRLHHEALEQLLQDIRDILRRSGFRFQDSWARVITGTQEGIYGWLALNYQQGLLQQAVRQTPPATALRLGPSRTRSPGDQHPTDPTLGPAQNTTPYLGALDMGGSSLEMTFEVNLDSQTTSAVGEFQNVTLGDKLYHLHTHTFPHYGLNEGYDQAVTLLYAQQHGSAAQRQDLQPATSHQHQSDQANADGTPPPMQDRGKLAAAGIGLSHNEHMIEFSTSNSSSGSSGATSAGAAAQQQADLDSASTAGFQARASSYTTVQISPANSTLHSAALLEQHRQADLAVAAAAGLHPRPSAAALAAEQVQTDAAVAAAAGMLSTEASTQNEPAPVPATRGAASSSSVEQEPGSNTGSIGSSRVLIAPGAQQALHHESDIADSMGTVDTSASVHLDTVSSNTSNSSSTSGAESSNSQQVPPAGLRHPMSASGVLSAAAKHSLQSRSLLQYIRRKQRRHRRQVLLQAEAEVLLHPALQFGSSLAQELEALVLLRPARTAVPLSLSRKQTLVKQPTVRIKPLDPFQRHDVASDAGLMAVDSSRQLLARDIPGDHSGNSPGTNLNGLGLSVVPPSAAPAPVNFMTWSSGQAAAAQGATDAHVPPAPVLIDSSQLPIVVHPCLHQDFQAPYERTAYEGHKPQPPKIFLIGQPNWPLCLKLIDEVVNATAPCHTTAQRPVCRLGAAQPHLKGRFLALTGVYIVRKFLNVPPDASMDQVLQAAQELCSRPWWWVQQNMGQQINAERYCTWGPYTVKLLREGLLLEDGAVHVGGGNVGWTVGAALSEASKLDDMMGQTATACASTRAESADPTLAERVDIGQRGAASVAPTQAYPQQSGWSQRFWGRQKHMHMGHVSAVLFCIVAWLSVVLICLSSQQQGAGVGVTASWQQPTQFKGPGRAALSPVLPVVGHNWGRNGHNAFRNSIIKH